MPTPIAIDGQTVRVFCSSRDQSNVGRVGYVDIEVGSGLRVIGASPKPALDLGEPGSFDDNGVAPSSVVTLPDGTMRLYYVGFELSTRVRYRMLTGVADSLDGGESFQRLGGVPILERSSKERLFRCGPFVRSAITGGFQMWYAGGSSWATVHGKQLPRYDIKYVESADGLSWPSEGVTVLTPTEPAEHGLGRPFIAELNGEEIMLLSIRDAKTATYKLGCAVRTGSASWARCDERICLAGLGKSLGAAELMYATTLRLADKWVLFYNGRDFGADGFEVAVLC